MAQRHRDTVMCGRTHGQPGLPITFGFKAAVWAAERIATGFGSPRAEVAANSSSSAGRWGRWSSGATRRCRCWRVRSTARAGRAGDPVDHRPGRHCRVRGTPRDGHRDPGEDRPGGVRPAASRDRGAREPFTPGQVGSITMPHKRNPELSEQLVTLARVVRADAGVAVEGMVHEHERDGRSWKAEWVVLPEACLLTGAALVRLPAARRTGGRCRADAREPARSGGYVLSEPVMRALADRFGKHTAHKVVYEATWPVWSVASTCGPHCSRIHGSPSSSDRSSSTSASTYGRLSSRAPSSWIAWSLPARSGPADEPPHVVAPRAVGARPDTTRARTTALGGARRRGVVQTGRPHRAGTRGKQGPRPRVPAR